MYCLNKDDKEDIKILIGLGQSILETKEKLIILEQEGKKNDKQYKTAIEWLHSTLLLEENVYKRIGSEPEKIKAIIFELTSTPDKDIELVKQIENIIALNQSKIIKNRILNKLNLRSINDNVNEINSLAQIIGINKDTNKSTIIKPHSILATNQAIINDIVAAIMVILNKEINNPENPKNVQDFLIRIKYYFSHAFEYIQNDLINNNFEVSSDLYITSQALAEFYGIDLNIYKSALIHTAKDIVIPSMSYLNGVANNDFNNRNMLPIIKIYEILMRSGLIFVPEEVSNEISKVMMRNIQIKLTEHRKDTSDHFIIQIVKKSEKDKVNCKSLSLRLKKES